MYSNILICENFQERHLDDKPSNYKIKFQVQLFKKRITYEASIKRIFCNAN